MTFRSFPNQNLQTRAKYVGLPPRGTRAPVAGAQCGPLKRRQDRGVRQPTGEQAFGSGLHAPERAPQHYLIARVHRLRWARAAQAEFRRARQPAHNPFVRARAESVRRRLRQTASAVPAPSRKRPPGAGRGGTARLQGAFRLRSRARQALTAGGSVHDRLADHIEANERPAPPSHWPPTARLVP